MSIFLEAEMKSGAFSSWGGPAMKKEKGASGALVVVLGREQQCFPGFPAMDVTDHGARDCGRDDEAW
ncbi:hypothetical protein EUC41_09705 [Achromobacter denitrificans]|uniref:hypothetical protein n=1 Tax=Achromobacter denitrificans TaxID=32002 RepID=UPI00240E93F4|nr:hypothetical protein [Achromobacter denitrificans]MBV2161548.1 hypothetical protein [Achromobacter denitrificans]MDX3879825.1 hypothetical protein [Achromobacter sp.]WFC66561.1 hypothetical protein EUC41_09705 [Achromobacter denitrificans]